MAETVFQQRNERISQTDARGPAPQGSKANCTGGSLEDPGSENRSFTAEAERMDPDNDPTGSPKDSLRGRSFTAVAQHDPESTRQGEVPGRRLGRATIKA